MKKTDKKPARKPEKSHKKGVLIAEKPAKKERDHRMATLEELADEHSVEKRTVNQWVKKHGCPRESRGLYDRKKVNSWKDDRHRAELELAQVGGEDEKAARARLISNQADMVEHKLGQLKGEYIKVTDATFIMSNAAVEANKEFDEIPKTASLTVLTLETADDIEKYLRELINAAKINVTAIGENARAFAKRYSSDILLPEILDAQGDLDNLAVGGKKAHAAHRTKRVKGAVEEHHPPTVHL